LLRTAFAAVLLLPITALRISADSQDRARDLIERAIANQHRDDAAIYSYERAQKRVDYNHGVLVSDETYRLVPTGTGRLSLLVKRAGQPVDLASYQRELRDWQQVLSHAIDPGDPRERRSEAERREIDRKRAHLIDAIGRAFRPTWLGETVEDGRSLARIQFDPDSTFIPDSRETELFRHVRAVVWIDEQTAQLVRARAEIISDISLGDGFLGKIDRGGHFNIDQVQVAPDLWLPSRVEYSIRGRRFFIPFEERKVTLTSHYGFIGSPLQASKVVRGDLASGRLFSSDP
jgi:hypothetical protein